MMNTLTEKLNKDMITVNNKYYLAISNDSSCNTLDAEAANYELVAAKYFKALKDIRVNNKQNLQGVQYGN